MADRIAAAHPDRHPLPDTITGLPSEADMLAHYAHNPHDQQAAVNRLRETAAAIEREAQRRTK